MSSKALCWLRRDLRTHDHVALSQALKNHNQVVVIFILDDHILNPLQTQYSTDRRVQFIGQSLLEIDQTFRTHHGNLLLEKGDPTHIIPKIMRQFKCEALYFNRDYSPYALSRDQIVTQNVQEMGFSVYSFQDHVIMEPEHILNKSNLPYRVFTPYSQAWLNAFTPELVTEAPVASFENISPCTPHPALSSLENFLDFAGFSKTTLQQPGGAQAGLSRLHTFSEQLPFYTKSRDLFNIDGTSMLSVYLRHGCISIREVFRLGLAHTDESAHKWILELIWREFYQMVLWHFPQTKNHPFQNKFSTLIYPGKTEHWEAFKIGETGFPIIDAAMRCLNQTGWMHNRLRMIVASFLTKILLIDWRKGERYFAHHLLDYELASNIGGWQWAAGVGCDAAPYFRIFNPYTQSITYDPSGEFIQQWCPELAMLSTKNIHKPPLHHKNYPLPIVDYSLQRKKALAILGEN